MLRYAQMAYTNGNIRKTTFKEVVVSQLDLPPNSYYYTALKLVDIMRKSGNYPKHPILTGIDGGPIADSGTFGSRIETWGVPVDHFIELASRSDRINVDWTTESPMLYAMDAAEIPALVVYDRTQLVLSEKYDTLWTAKTGVHMDAIAKTVLYIPDQDVEADRLSDRLKVKRCY